MAIGSFGSKIVVQMLIIRRSRVYPSLTSPRVRELTNWTVYPGDSITSTFSLNTATNVWTDAWSLSPGATGAAAGQKAQTGTVTNNFGTLET